MLRHFSLRTLSPSSTSNLSTDYTISIYFSIYPIERAGSYIHGNIGLLDQITERI